MSVRHEIFDPTELEAKDAAEIPKAANLLTREQVHSLLADSQQSLATIQAIQERIASDTAKIDRNLKGNVINERVAAIKHAAQSSIDPALAKVRENAAIAKSQERFWNPVSIRMRASFDNDPAKDAAISLAWMKKIGKMDGVMLTELSALAAATGSLALAGLVESEVSSRASDDTGNRSTIKPYQRGQIMSYVNSIPNSSAEVMTALKEAQYLVGAATAAATGRQASIEKIRQGLLHNELNKPHPLGIIS